MKKQNNYNIICIIPARGGSRGIPQKNLITFCGKPLLQWSIEQACASNYIKKVYVSSDDRQILQLSARAGAGQILRPKKFASSVSSSEEALLHAMDIIEEAGEGKIDIVVFLQATSPVRESSDIDSALRLFMRKRADSLFSAAVLRDYCIWRNDNGRMKSITFDYTHRGRRQERPCFYLENGSLYIFKPRIIKRYHNRLGGRITIYPMPLWKSHEIDTVEDIEICRYYMETKILKEEDAHGHRSLS